VPGDRPTTMPGVKLRAALSRNSINQFSAAELRNLWGIAR
jgi:hypothetical protein